MFLLIGEAILVRFCSYAILVVALCDDRAGVLMWSLTDAAEGGCVGHANHHAETALGRQIGFI